MPDVQVGIQSVNFPDSMSMDDIAKAIKSNPDLMRLSRPTTARTKQGAGPAASAPSAARTSMRAATTQETAKYKTEEAAAQKRISAQPRYDPSDPLGKAKSMAEKEMQSKSVAMQAKGAIRDMLVSMTDPRMLPLEVGLAGAPTLLAGAAGPARAALGAEKARRVMGAARTAGKVAETAGGAAGLYTGGKAAVEAARQGKPGAAAAFGLGAALAGAGTYKLVRDIKTERLVTGKEKPGATQERQVQESRVGKHPGDGEVRPPAEAGGSSGAKRGAEVGKQVGQEAKKVEAGAILTSKSGLEFKYLRPEIKGQGRGKPKLVTGKEVIQGVASGEKQVVPRAQFDRLNLKTPETASTPTKLQSTVVPGAEEFISQDVGPALQELAQAPEKIKGALTEAFNPPGVAKSAEVTARKLRSELGESAHSEAVARNVLSDARKFFTKSLVKLGGGPTKGGVPQSSHPAIRFIRAMESGKPLDTDMSKLQPLADWMRDSREAKWKEIQSAGITDAYLDNYWPHLWQKPSKVTNFLRQLIGRKPFAGPESFKKQRTIPTFDEGLEKGLEPITWNPVEQHMLHLHEMNRSLVAHRTWDYLKSQNLSKFVRFGESPPEGFAKVNDKIARAIEMQPTTKASGEPGAPQPVIRGEWYLPAPAARILNNYLSPGLRGNYLFDAMHGAGNLLNQAQLGMSAFHATFVGLDAAASHTAVGIQALSEGRLATAAKGLAQGLSGYAAPKSLVRGQVLKRAYLDPGLDPASPLGKTVDLLKRAGARVEQAPEYSNRSYASLVNALEHHNYPGAALRAIPAAFELAAKPIMEFTVPRLKLGVAETMLKNEVERLGPNATQEQITASAQKVWDSVDNRMGQLVYDNLFWHNYLKQAGQLSQRSLGWNLGSVRELGGAAKDFATTPWRLKAGDKPLTGRMAYAIALPMQTALAGSILYYLYNKKPPPTLKDALQPTIDGERWQLATYMRDIMPGLAAAREGIPGVYAETGKRAVSKLNPIFASTNEFLRNEDYWGNPIYGDSPEAKGAMKWFVEQMTPFSLREGPKRPSTREEKTRQFFGLTRVPKEKTIAEQQYGQGLGLLKSAKKKGFVPPKKASTTSNETPVERRIKKLEKGPKLPF